MIDVEYNGNKSKRVDLDSGAIQVMKYKGKYIISYISGATLIQKEYCSIKGINNFANKYGVNFIQKRP